MVRNISNIQLYYLVDSFKTNLRLIENYGGVLTVAEKMYGFTKLVIDNELGRIIFRSIM